MHPQMVIIIDKGLLLSAGGSRGFKNGHPQVRIGIVHIIQLWANQPCHLFKIPAVFPIIVQGGPESVIELIIKCVIKGGKDDPWCIINSQVIFDQCELVRQRCVSYHDNTLDFQKLHVIGLRHIPLLFA